MDTTTLITQLQVLKAGVDTLSAQITDLIAAATPKDAASSTSSQATEEKKDEDTQ